MYKSCIFLAFAALLIYSTSAKSQTDSTMVSANSSESADSSDFSYDLKADFVSRYVWRGMNLSESPSIQPTMSIAYKNLSFGSWASYSFAKEELQEVDLFLSYESDYVTFTINDYYNPYDSLGGTDDYFHCNNATTRHSFEGVLRVNGPESFPLGLETGVMFFGNDRDIAGKNLYSTYIELNYEGKFRGTEYKPFIGFTPKESYYGDGAGIVNMGIIGKKEIKVSDSFSLPLSLGLMVNPQKEKIYFVVGISI